MKRRFIYKKEHAECRFFDTFPIFPSDETQFLFIYVLQLYSSKYFVSASEVKQIKEAADILHYLAFQRGSVRLFNG